MHDTSRYTQVFIEKKILEAAGQHRNVWRKVTQHKLNFGQTLKEGVASHWTVSSGWGHEEDKTLCIMDGEMVQ